MVRIIAGTARGRKLKTIDSEDTKPTLDRVKEAMFSMIMPYVHGAQVLDVFSGNGSLGIEALSRGAASCVFNDKSRECCRYIRENVEAVGFGGVSDIYTKDYRELVAFLRGRKKKFDLVLLDPPYGKDFVGEALCAISAGGIFSGAREDGPKCIAVAEHSVNDELCECYGVFKRIKTKAYGTVAVSLYEVDGGLL